MLILKALPSRLPAIAQDRTCHSCVTQDHQLHESSIVSRPLGQSVRRAGPGACRRSRDTGAADPGAMHQLKLPHCSEVPEQATLRSLAVASTETRQGSLHMSSSLGGSCVLAGAFRNNTITAIAAAFVMLLGGTSALSDDASLMYAGGQYASRPFTVSLAPYQICMSNVILQHTCILNMGLDIRDLTSEICKRKAPPIGIGLEGDREPVRRQ